MTKIDELLAVLDMPEDEQIKWVDSHIGRRVIYQNGIAWYRESLADLAFKERDEAVKTNRQFYEEGLYLVSQKRWIDYQVMKNINIIYEEWCLYATPIEIIIAAQIAKQ
jgi:hypothetical protein